MKNQSVIIFGEVLFDCFPDGNIVLGGAPFNVAWHLQAFGVSPLFISRIGDDSYGNNIKEAMQNWGMDLSGLQLDSEHPTGVVNVNFINNEPHYEIVENSAYDFIQSSRLPSLQKDAILYHGTLALRSQSCVETLQKIKADISPSIFLDVNLRTPWWNLKSVELLLKEISWLKLNEDELSLIVPQESNTENRIKYLLSTFPLNYITLTQGKAGAISFQSNGDRESIAPSQTTSVIDTVGAGDAFSSVLVLGIVKNWEISKTLVRAQEFASAIVGIQGATTQDQSFYQSFLRSWN
jgi:fructokinase